MLYVGVDEVGRGCIAGPMVVCGVLIDDIISNDSDLIDSKKITPRKRLMICSKYINTAQFAISLVSNVDIDKFGISKAFEIAINKVKHQLGHNHHYIIDGKYNIDFSPSHQFEYKAEDKFKAVALASIIAKEFRDSYMKKLCILSPGYGFSKHKGYGTITHRRSISELGYSQWHRKSFKIKINV